MKNPLALRLLVPLLVAISASAATVGNDDSCDISVLPAATLLLPYFEVDVDDPNGETTLFTVTNVTNADQIARVTLWTDYAYPVASFNIQLTGYDVQSINLRDVLARGEIPSPLARRGEFSVANAQIDASACAAPPMDVARMRAAFLEGRGPDCPVVGGVHERAIGYATIDVVGNCSTRVATDAAYWTEDIRFDNVFIGEYQQLNNARGLAAGSPMVHIRAVPEGGTAASRRTLVQYDAGFPRTFYSRYQSTSAPRLDGRQPLPSTFAARWREGGADNARTSLKIWREGKPGAACFHYENAEDLRVTEVVVFDDDENTLSTGRFLTVNTAEILVAELLPNATGTGWAYLNLDHTRGDGFASQNWVITSTRSEGRMATDADAIALGNGCSPESPTSGFTLPDAPPIAPAPDANAPGVIATTDNDASCDIALLPAATLLLPYFEVDHDSPNGERTELTVTNVSPEQQIAHVTLWTDFGYPVLDFNLRLAAYDTQTIDLYDLIENGLLGENVCGSPAQLPAEMITRVQQALTIGRADGVGPVARCNTVGNAHDHAIGYATIDIVRSCSADGPASPQYWTRDLAYDNVLTGDSRQLNRSRGLAQGAPLVHIRAIGDGTELTRTFYSSLQSPRTPTLDARQPLPSLFAARWIQGSEAELQTSFKIWREKTVRDSTCSSYPGNLVTVGGIVRFDDAENAVATLPPSALPPLPTGPILPLTSLVSVADDFVFPQLVNGAISGWMYVNLDDTCLFPNELCTRPPTPFANQAWVVTSMRAGPRFSVDSDAAALGNGCSEPATKTQPAGGATVIGPAPDEP